MRKFDRALDKLAAREPSWQFAARLFLLALFFSCSCPGAVNAQLYSESAPSHGAAEPYSASRSLLAARAHSPAASFDALSRRGPGAGGAAGMAAKAMSSAAPLCSACTAAPGNAQGLSNGAYTYAVVGSSSGTV